MSLPAPAADRLDTIRLDFPGLHREVHGKPLIYFDNAATAMRPRQCIDAMDSYYRDYNANVHRGVHSLSAEATDAFEGARKKVHDFLGAGSERHVVFTRGSTEAINLVSQSFARPRLEAGDEILVSRMEHHANLVPWQLVCQQTGAKLVEAPMHRNGELDLDALVERLSARTCLLGLVHVSNALGTINPVEEAIEAAHARDIPVLIDGSQAAPHLPVDVTSLNADFYCVTAHKMFGPTGIGALIGRADLLEEMPPYHGGGDMIHEVHFDRSVFADPPMKFEAGTPNIAAAIGWGATIDYLQSLGMDLVQELEEELLRHGRELFADVSGVRMVGTARRKVPVFSFVVDGVHPHDLGTILDLEGIAIRTGHHCAMPLMEYYGLSGTARASLAFYNTCEELDSFMRALDKARTMFA